MEKNIQEMYATSWDRYQRARTRITNATIKMVTTVKAPGNAIQKEALQYPGDGFTKNV